MNKLIDKMTESLLWPDTTWFFRRVFYVYLLWFFARLALHGDFFLGPGSYINYTNMTGNPLKWWVQMLNFDHPGVLYQVFLVVCLTALVAGLLGRWPFYASVVIWLTAVPLIYKVIDISNAGNQLAYILLFFNVFLIEEKKKTPRIWRRTIANFGLMMCRMHIVLLYAVAGITKLTGELWPQGTAFYYVSQIPEYSTPWLAEFIAGNQWFGLALTYFTLFYQVGFPVFIWFRKIRYKWMFIGALFHLGIGFLNGIMDFGLVMIASYFLFYENYRSEPVRVLAATLEKRLPFRLMGSSGK